MKASGKTLVLLVVLCFVVTGCIGSFAAFNKLLDWNQQATDQKWVNEVIFLGLNIIPVYGIAYLGDILIFNAIEFWTGNNPMAEARMSKNGPHRVIQMFSDGRAGKTTTISYYDREELRHTLTLTQASPSAPLVGHVDWVDGRTEDFSVSRTEDGLSVQHSNWEGKVTKRLYEGKGLEEIAARTREILGGRMVAGAGY